MPETPYSLCGLTNGLTSLPTLTNANAECKMAYALMMTNNVRIMALIPDLPRRKKGGK